MNWIGWKMPKIAPVPKLLVKLRRFKDGLVYISSGDVKMVWFSHSGDAIQFTSWQKVKSESWFHRTCHTKYKMHNAKWKMKNVKSKQWKLISQELSYKMNNAKYKKWKLITQDLSCFCHPACLAWPLPWYDHHQVRSRWPQFWWQLIDYFCEDDSNNQTF